MKEYILVFMLESAPIGARFTMWSLHMTLLPWFNAPDFELVFAKLKQKLERFEPFEIEAGGPSQMGHRNLPAKLINNSPKLQSLHDALLRMIDENDWDLQGRYTGQHFKPHVTRKKGMDANGKYLLDAVYIVEKQSQGYREIVGKVDLA